MTEEEYQRRERECIAEYDGKLTREQAEKLAAHEADVRIYGTKPAVNLPLFGGVR